MNSIQENRTDLETLRNDIVIKQKKGLPFIGASVVIWLLILMVIMLDLPQDKENLFVFCSSCPLLPISWIIGKVLKVEAADLAFAIDSMLAAVALAVTLPKLGDITIGGINGGQFTVMFLGGIIGLIIMRFAAQWFVKVLEKYPQLETAAFLIVGWVGVKLTVMTLSHPNVLILPEDFPHSFAWKTTFWVVLVGIAVLGYVTGVRAVKKNEGK